MQLELLEVLVIRLAVIDVSWLGGLVIIDTTTTTTTTTTTRELIERFRKLKGLYNLKKNIQCAYTHNYTNQWYTSVQNIRILTNRCSEH